MSFRNFVANINYKRKIYKYPHHRSHIRHRKSPLWKIYNWRESSRHCWPTCIFAGWILPATPRQHFHFCGRHHQTRPSPTGFYTGDFENTVGDVKLINYRHLLLWVVLIFTAVKKLTKNPRTVPFNRIDVRISHLTSYIIHFTSYSSTHSELFLY